MESLQIIVLIPTIGRESLFSRALPSVLSQRRHPDLVVVAVDVKSTSNLSATMLKDHFHHLNRIPEQTKTPEVVWIENVRTPGLSGTLNSGLYYILHHRLERGWYDADMTYIALLDDDDGWTDIHLSTLLDALPSPLSTPHLVINGIIRIEDETQAHCLQSIPILPLSVDQFLIGNPHIQGSNLFCSLKVLALAGYFDEALPSCTDRDLMIRILDLGPDQVFIRTTPHHTVYHFALSDPQQPRLSQAGSISKMSGLTRTLFIPCHLFLLIVALSLTLPFFI